MQCMMANTLIVSLVFLHFTFAPSLDDNFKLYPINNGRNLLIDSKLLERDVSKKILQLNRKAKKVLKNISIFFNFFGTFYCGLMVLLNGVYLLTFHSLLVLCFYMPFYIFYMMHGESKA